MPGPKERSELIAKDSRKIRKKNFTFLDYEMHTGSLDGKRVTVGNGGRYAPDTAITTEILCGAGAQSLIRVGSCGSLQEHIQIGDLVIVTGALRGDGTSRYYVAENFSTIADAGIVARSEKRPTSSKCAIILVGSSPPTRFSKRRRN